MTYADYNFYCEQYHGDTLEANAAERWLDMAGDELDVLTFGRLETAFPVVERHAVKVKKAACAIADALFLIDTQRQAAAAQKSEDGTYRGAVASISSGKESISYSAVGAAASAFAAAAADASEQVKLICGIASRYLANIPDANGVNLLYAGG